MGLSALTGAPERSRHRGWLSLVVLTSSVWLSSSASAYQVELPPISDADRQDSPVGAGIPSPTEMPSLEECEEFANELTAAVAVKDEKRCNELLEWNSILTRTIARVQTSDEVRQEYINGFLNPASGPLASPFGGFEAGTTFSLLRVRTKNGKRYGLFRLIPPIEVGVSYHELPLIKRGDGSVVGEDIYIYNVGEFLSTGFRRSYMQAVPPDKEATLSDPNDSELLQNLPLLTRMTECIRMGNGRGALDAYDAMPPSMRKEKMFVVMRLKAASLVGEQEYQNIVEQILRTQGRDPSLDLILISIYAALGRYSEAFAALDRIEVAIGGDPYLDVIRSNFYSKRGNLRSAREFAQAAAAADPKLVPARLAIVNCAMYQRDYAEVARQLLVLEELGQEIADLTAVSGYRRFVASPAYGEWMAERRRRAENLGKP